MLKDCVLCKIVSGEENAEKVLETEKFVVVKDKYPRAPVHVLVIDKQHRTKKDTLAGKYTGYWDRMLSACWKAVKKLGLDETGYKIVNNGAGYNHFEHEHTHVMGGDA